jgi:iron complex outermembrane receptor protein
MAIRLAVSSTDRRGTIYNVTTDKWVNELDNLGLRGSLLWRPTGALNVTLAGDYNRQNPECCAQIYVRTGRPSGRSTASSRGSRPRSAMPRPAPTRSIA